MAQAEAAPILVIESRRPSRFVEAIKRAPLIPLLILLFFVVLAIFADVISPYSPVDVTLRDRLTPPFWQSDGSLSHPFGTDPLGRDLATRVAYGAQTTLMVAGATVLLSAAIGVVLNQYQGGMCISGRLTMTERTPRHLISPLGPNWEAPIVRSSDMYISPWL